MANYKILNSNIKAGTHEFLVDTAADLDKLPIEIGSIALVANTGEVYIMNNQEQWVKL